ncbi:hypothetical protein JCM10207_001408, partial [Rhodosporidiobolus poonsookiae]
MLAATGGYYLLSDQYEVKIMRSVGLGGAVVVVLAGSYWQYLKKKADRAALEKETAEDDVDSIEDELNAPGMLEKAEELATRNRTGTARNGNSSSRRYGGGGTGNGRNGASGGGGGREVGVWEAGAKRRDQGVGTSGSKPVSVPVPVTGPAEHSGSEASITTPIDPASERTVVTPPGSEASITTPIDPASERTVVTPPGSEASITTPIDPASERT